MIHTIDLLIVFLIAGLSSFLLTYPLKKLAFTFNVVDLPNARKIHKHQTARLGGLAIFISFTLSLLYLRPVYEHMLEIILGAVVIVVTGLLDDRFTLRPVVKLSGQLIASSFLISSGLIIERITLPIVGVVDLGFASVLITVLWVVGITNAINLIDGLDGLATGVTTIAFISMFIMALIDGQIVATYLCVILIGANLGFLYHNFYPASIYMGDTGSNFLGYMIAVVSMLGLFKNITLFSFIIPVIVLAVPIFDMLFAILRRLYHQEGIMMPDRKHIHYQLLDAGYSHQRTVLIIYTFSALFGCLAILFSYAPLTLSLLITVLVLMLLHLLAEVAGIVRNGKKPLLNILKKSFKRKKRHE